MDSKKYIGMDVHKESISIAMMNGAGKIGMECVIETKASMILQSIDGLRGDVYVTFEEGTSAAWLYDLLKPHVTKLVVCDPRKNASMREGNQSDKIDARRLAELLRLMVLEAASSSNVLKMLGWRISGRLERAKTLLGSMVNGDVVAVKRDDYSSAAHR